MEGLRVVRNIFWMNTISRVKYQWGQWRSAFFGYPKADESSTSTLQSVELLSTHRKLPTPSSMHHVWHFPKCFAPTSSAPYVRTCERLLNLLTSCRRGSVATRAGLDECSEKEASIISQWWFCLFKGTKCNLNGNGWLWVEHQSSIGAAITIHAQSFLEEGRYNGFVVSADLPI